VGQTSLEREQPGLIAALRRAVIEHKRVADEPELATMLRVREPTIHRHKEKPMPSIRGTATEKNLLKAFAGESQARNRYTYAAAAAEKEGFRQIAAIFRETADNEKEHAKRFFSFLDSGEALEITAATRLGRLELPPTIFSRQRWEKMKSGRTCTLPSQRLRKWRDSRSRGCLHAHRQSREGA